MKKSISRKYHLFDAKDQVVGRLATQLAKILRGKDRVDFTPNIDGGDAVVVINTDLIAVSGNKEEGKTYYHFSGYPGGLKKESLKVRREKDSRDIVYKAVRGMLPKNKLRDQMLLRLRLYKGANHDHKTIHVTHQ